LYVSGCVITGFFLMFDNEEKFLLAIAWPIVAVIGVAMLLVHSCVLLWRLIKDTWRWAIWS